MELINDSLETTPAPTKLAYACLAASLILLGASVVCWLCGNDPLGGASLSPHSLKAAEVGLLASIPLVAAKAWSWTDDAHERFPALDQMQRDRMEQLQPLLASLTLPQAGFAMLLDTVPTLVLGLPAALGALETGYGAAARWLTKGAAFPDSLPFALALMTAAAVAAISGWTLEDEDATEQEEVVLTAVANADRYYRVLRPDAPEAAERAFRNVAAAWLLMRESTSQLAGYAMSTQIVFLGMLWRLTGDLSAPAVAALAGAAVDTWHLHSRVNGRGADRAR